MSPALRFVARKICDRALSRPQAYFTACASAAVKEEQRLLLPRISHGGSSLRRFSSSEPPNLPHNNKLGPKSGANNTNATAPTGSLARQVEEKKHELLDLLRRMEGESSSMGNEHMDLQHLLQRSNNRFLATIYKVTVVSILAANVTMFVGYDYVFGLKNK